MTTLRKKIVILKLNHTSFCAHQVDHYAHRWANMGFYISYSFNGNNLIDADIIVMCIDSTIVPTSVTKKLMGYKAKILNFSILDISKRNFSSLILSRNSPWRGKVIAKTNRNSYGRPEITQEVIKNKAKQHIYDLRCIDEKTLSENKGKLSLKEYLIYPSIQHVPDFFWNSPDLVMERFIPPNPKQSQYRVYFYSFFGEQGICGFIDSKTPIVRWDTESKVSYMKNPPSIVYEWKLKYKIDFGRFDFILEGDCWHLIDINKTEGSAGYQDIPIYAKEFNHLARGIHSFL